MAVPVPRTWVASEFVSATIMNGDIRDTFNFLLQPPRAYCYRTADKTTTDGVWALYDMDAELYDPYSTPAHDNATNNSRLVAAETGIYTINCQVATSDLSATLFKFMVRKNAAGASGGGTQLMLNQQNGAGGAQPTVLGRTFDAPLTAGDYIEFFIQTNSTTPETITAGSGNTFLAFRWAAKTS